MNKKEAVAYAQITLDYMQSSKYKGELNPETLGIEMKQCFKLYPKDVAVMVANNIVETEKEILSKKINHNFFESQYNFFRGVVMEQVITTKETKKEYEIIPSFNNNGETIESVIQSAFLKYLKYNDYK